MKEDLSTQSAAALQGASDTPATEKMIERFANMVIERRLETPAIFFLEMNKPLAEIMGQSVLLGSPLLAPLIGIENVRTFSALLRDSRNVERLIERIEEMHLEREQGPT